MNTNPKFKPPPGFKKEKVVEPLTENQIMCWELLNEILLKKYQMNVEVPETTKNFKLKKDPNYIKPYNNRNYRSIALTVQKKGTPNESNGVGAKLRRMGIDTDDNQSNDSIFQGKRMHARVQHRTQRKKDAEAVLLDEDIYGQKNLIEIKHLVQEAQ